LAHEKVVMAENKTIPNDQNVELVLNAVADEQKRRDSFALLELMKEVTGLEPTMWGSSIVGFGSYHYNNLFGNTSDMRKCRR
jgi:hypothetical protein